MATYRSVQADNLNDITNGTYSPNPVNQQNGVLRAAYFSYTKATALSTGDIIELCQVPAGARILGIHLCNTDWGTTVPIKIGDASDDDRLFTSVSSDVLGTEACANLSLNLDDTDTDDEPSLGYGYKYTSNTTLLMTIGTVTSGAGGTFRGHVSYVVN